MSSVNAQTREVSFLLALKDR